MAARRPTVLRGAAMATRRPPAVARRCRSGRRLGESGGSGEARVFLPPSAGRGSRHAGEAVRGGGRAAGHAGGAGPERDGRLGAARLPAVHADRHGAAPHPRHAARGRRRACRGTAHAAHHGRAARRPGGVQGGSGEVYRYARYSAVLLPSRSSCSLSFWLQHQQVSLWGSSGRMEMTASKFMDIQRAIQPDWFQCIADGDTISGEVSKKRAKKSVDRSLSFLDACLQLLEKAPELQGSVMFGTIEGGDVLEERLRSARETAKRPVGGFLLDGFQGHAMAKETKLNLISSVTAELPEDKPRIIHGVGKPDEVLECIERGVDIFESFFPFQVTERGCALVFGYDYHSDPKAAVLKQDGAQDLEKNGTEEDKEEVVKADPEMTPFEIFLKEKRYYDDFRPLLEGCTCYCCQRHTRAYLHHLLVSNELLAGVLLMMHNFQHYFSFFSTIRDALRDDKLDQLKKLIFSQALQGPENAKIDQ
ncbi:queuine tRNA-ribosyltransferase accessory subunit 2 isoform X2 [Phasianus colchicus]|uniref:queuine tRNA-ribosyltransferase accessory subunit 2 isoform X2 n=1 Tax=Phasianus colchicus TaxID=9054 RepID=UPI00129E6556|nr:queuine tRNA-ribosyltransferase accessory subunit 2 isoform X2 [Phasianus colchicus]